VRFFASWLIEALVFRLLKQFLEHESSEDSKIHRVARFLYLYHFTTRSIVTLKKKIKFVLSGSVATVVEPLPNV
jgi:hypothetical protein